MFVVSAKVSHNIQKRQWNCLEPQLGPIWIHKTLLSLYITQQNYPVILSMLDWQYDYSILFAQLLLSVYVLYLAGLQ